MILKLESFVGSDISGCAQKAVAIANKIGTTVCFNFNGVACYARPGDNPALLVENYHHVFRNGTKPLMAFANSLPEPKAKAPELLPCPFCGGEAELFKKVVGDYIPKTVYGVECQTKGCWSYEAACAWFTKEKAVEFWNNRKGGE